MKPRDLARLDRSIATYKASLAAARSWVAHWFPRRNAHPAARHAARWAIGNAKFARWMLGGRYPSVVNGK